MPHFCLDELLMLMAAIPFAGHFFNKIHSFFHKKISHTNH